MVSGKEVNPTIDRASLTKLDVVAMSATALSHTVAELEARPGVRLFNRTARVFSLTRPFL